MPKISEERLKAIKILNAKEARSEFDSISNKLKELFKDDMNEDELKSFDNLRAEHEEVKKRIEELDKEERNNFKNNLEKEARSAYIKSIQEIKKPDKEDRAGGNNPKISAEPKQKYKRQFRNLFDQVTAIRNFRNTGSIDNRLAYVESELTQRSATGMNSLVGSEGAFLIEPEFARPIYDDAIKTGSILSRVSQYPTTSNEVKWKTIVQNDHSIANGVMGGTLVYWAGEADTVEASKMKFGESKIELHKLMGIGYVTEEISEDATFISNLYKQAFSKAIRRKLEHAIIWGDGVGKIKGIMNSDSLITIAKETGQPAGTFDYNNIRKMWNRLSPERRANSVWLVNNFAEGELELMSFAVGTGGVPVYLPNGGLKDTPYSTLRGRPVIPTDLLSATGTKGDIILADLNDFMLLKKGGNLEGKFEVSMHVRFLYGEDAFRIILRVGGKTFTSETITPNNAGGNTISPYITLATRS